MQIVEGPPCIMYSFCKDRSGYYIIVLNWTMFEFPFFWGVRFWWKELKIRSLGLLYTEVWTMFGQCSAELFRNLIQCSIFVKKKKWAAAGSSILPTSAISNFKLRTSKFEIFWFEFDPTLNRSLLSTSSHHSSIQKVRVCNNACMLKTYCSICLVKVYQFD